MNAIASDPKLSFETVLVGLIEDWLTADAAKLPVVICGMAGAKQGWLEAPYCDVPARPSDLAQGAVAPKVSDPRISVFILPGLCQRGDADVMRGEKPSWSALWPDILNFPGGSVCPEPIRNGPGFQTARSRRFAPI